MLRLCNWLGEAADVKLCDSIEEILDHLFSYAHNYGGGGDAAASHLVHVGSFLSHCRFLVKKMPNLQQEAAAASLRCGVVVVVVVASWYLGYETTLLLSDSL
jgi:hypothetical protein